MIASEEEQILRASPVSALDRPPIYEEPGVRVVELNRVPDGGLGISIVGGKADLEGLGLKGIYIRHVLESSPAGRLGTLSTGDQILEVRYLCWSQLLSLSKEWGGCKPYDFSYREMQDAEQWGRSICKPYDFSYREMQDAERWGEYM